MARPGETHGPPRRRYRALNGFLRNHFGFRVQKIALDAGFSCPNRDGTLSDRGCIYCDRLGSGSGAWAKGLGIGEQIEASADRIRSRYGAKGFLAYFQSFTNTYAPLDQLKQRYDEALSHPEVVGLCVGTRPDCVGDAVLELLAEYAKKRMVWIEYGLQSAHDATLSAINRGHDFQAFVDAVERTSGRGIWVCVHLIVGLPGEGADEIRETARRIASLPLHGLKIHALYVVRGTQMERLCLEGKYHPWGLAEFVESACDILERVPSSWVIQRLTSDPPPDVLVAPLWTLEKHRTIQAIQSRLEQRDTWQGRLFQKVV